MITADLLALHLEQIETLTAYFQQQALSQSLFEPEYQVAKHILVLVGQTAPDAETCKQVESLLHSLAEVEHYDGSGWHGFKISVQIWMDYWQEQSLKQDGLTGLSNYRAIADFLADGSQPFAVFLDIDQLIWANDHWGYAYGDQVLVQLSVLLKNMAQFLGGECFRTGGDEFVVILPTCSHTQALDFAQNVLQAVNEQHWVYARTDQPHRNQIALNAVVSRISSQLPVQISGVRNWVADAIWQAKEEDGSRIEVIADTGEKLPSWA